MAGFCAFLFDFKAVTEKLHKLETPHETDKIKDPWWQLRIALRSKIHKILKGGEGSQAGS